MPIVSQSSPAGQDGRHPALPSGGRFILGLGAGWHAEEHRAYGYDFPAAPVRVQQLDEALQIIRALRTQKTATGMLRLTATYADWWNVSSTGIDGCRRMVKMFAAACAEVGRDPATVRRTWVGGCACAPTRAEAEALAGGRFSPADDDDSGFVGTPQQSVEQMRPFIDPGVDYFMLDCSGFPRLTALEMPVAEALPALNR